MEPEVLNSVPLLIDRHAIHQLYINPAEKSKLMGIGVKRRDKCKWTKEVFMECMKKLVLDDEESCSEQDIFDIIACYWYNRRNRNIDDFVVTVQYSPDKKNSYFSEMFHRMKEKGLELFTGQRIEYLIVNTGSDKMSSNVIAKQEWNEQQYELFYSKYLQLALNEITQLMQLSFGFPAKSYEARVNRFVSGTF